MYSPALARQASRIDPVELVLRGTAIVLAAGAAWIHWSLGSLIYTLNAVGFATLAIALVVPFEVVVGPAAGRALRTLVRLAVIAFAAATITGWLLIGARITLGYEATALEAAIAVVMAASIARATGSPAAVVRELLALVPAAARHAIR